MTSSPRASGVQYAATRVQVATRKRDGDLGRQLGASGLLELPFELRGECSLQDANLALPAQWPQCDRTHRLPRRFGRPPLSTKQKCPRIPGLVQPDHLDTRATCVISSAHSAEPGATMSTYSAAQRAREELELS
jgi:hypothetical protein